MDSDCVTESLSQSLGGGGSEDPHSFSSYSEIFDREFPKYLAMGMSLEQYWDGDNELPKFYREAYKIRLKDDNTRAWLYGLYTYRAVGALVPVMNAFATRGTKAENYMSEPIDLFGDMESEDIKYERQRDKMLRRMTDIMISNNRRFENEGG